jgi:hypothetical protein
LAKDFSHKREKMSKDKGRYYQLLGTDEAIRAFIKKKQYNIFEITDEDSRKITNTTLFTKYKADCFVKREVANNRFTLVYRSELGLKKLINETHLENVKVMLTSHDTDNNDKKHSRNTRKRQKHVVSSSKQEEDKDLVMDDDGDDYDDDLDDDYEENALTKKKVKVEKEDEEEGNNNHDSQLTASIKNLLAEFAGVKQELKDIKEMNQNLNSQVENFRVQNENLTNIVTNLQTAMEVNMVESTGKLEDQTHLLQQQTSLIHCLMASNVHLLEKFDCNIEFFNSMHSFAQADWIQSLNFCSDPRIEHSERMIFDLSLVNINRIGVELEQENTINKFNVNIPKSEKNRYKTAKDYGYLSDIDLNAIIKISTRLQTHYLKNLSFINENLVVIKNPNHPTPNNKEGARSYKCRSFEALRPDIFSSQCISILSKQKFQSRDQWFYFPVLEIFKENPLKNHYIAYFCNIHKNDDNNQVILRRYIFDSLLRKSIPDYIDKTETYLLQQNIISKIENVKITCHDGSMGQMNNIDCGYFVVGNLMNLHGLDYSNWEKIDNSQVVPWKLRIDHFFRLLKKMEIFVTYTANKLRISCEKDKQATRSINDVLLLHQDKQNNNRYSKKSSSIKNKESNYLEINSD